MTTILDAGGVGALAVRRALLDEMRRRGRWPARVPSVVLAEALTGDHRRDHGVNRLLRMCQILPVDGAQAREAARMRTATGRAGTITAVDAVVAAVASDQVGSVVVTSDPGDLRSLVAYGRHEVVVVTV